MFSSILIQTIALAFRKGGGAFGGLAFFIIVFTLFAFALSPEALHDYALAVMVVGMVLAGMVALPLIFAGDYEDGMLEQYVLKAAALELVTLAKLMGLWTAQFLPLLLIAPLLCRMAGVDSWQQVWLRLFVLSPGVASICVLTAALTLGDKRGGLSGALIGLPLLMPLVIFASTLGGGAVMLLLASSMVLVPVSCYVSGAILRLA